MRQSRIRIDDRDVWYHCFNRIAGTSNDLPFGPAEKEQFVRILRRVSLLYSVKIVSYQVMSNHFHLLVRAPAESPGAEETCRRYKAFHRGKRMIEPQSDTCRLWQSRCRDISWFMRHLQQLFSSWYNRTRPDRRRGSLWADRFKHTILEDNAAAWSCWKYIENNAVRANIVRDAADYRFCSYGVWCQTGRHPYEQNITTCMLPLAGGLFGLSSLSALKQALSWALNEDEDHARTGFTLSVARRVQHWTDGLVIGSELFIQEVMSRQKPRRLHHMSRTQSGTTTLYAWRNLRSVPE